MKVNESRVREIINEALDQFSAKQRVNVFVYELLAEMTQKQPEEFMEIISNDNELHMSIKQLSDEILKEIENIKKTGGKSGFYSRMK